MHLKHVLDCLSGLLAKPPEYSEYIKDFAIIRNRIQFMEFPVFEFIETYNS